MVIYIMMFSLPFVIIIPDKIQDIIFEAPVIVTNGTQSSYAESSAQLNNVISLGGRFYLGS